MARERPPWDERVRIETTLSRASREVLDALREATGAKACEVLDAMLEQADLRAIADAVRANRSRKAAALRAYEAGRGR